MSDNDKNCLKEVGLLLQCVSSRKYANISSCKEEMKALRECCVKHEIKNFAVVKECSDITHPVESDDYSKKKEASDA